MPNQAIDFDAIKSDQAAHLRAVLDALEAAGLPQYETGQMNYQIAGGEGRSARLIIFHGEPSVYNAALEAAGFSCRPPEIRVFPPREGARP